MSEHAFPVLLGDMVQLEGDSTVLITLSADGIVGVASGLGVLKWAADTGKPLPMPNGDRAHPITKILGGILR